MKNIDIIRRAAKNLRHAKSRTILTSLAIAVGAFTITLSFAVGAGTRSYADKIISSNVNPQAIFVMQDTTTSYETESPVQDYETSDVDADSSSEVSQLLSQDDIDIVANLDGVLTVLPMYTPYIQSFRFDGSDTRMTASISTYDSSIITDVSAGSLPAKNTQINDDEIVIPASFVDSFVERGLIDDASDLIGKKVILTAVRATVTPTEEEITQAYLSGGEDAVAALTQTETKDFTYTVVAVTDQSSLSILSSTSMLISPNSAREISEYTTKGTSDYQKYYAATVIAKDDVDVNTVKDKITNLGYYAQTAEDQTQMIFQVVDTLQMIVLGFGAIALLASVFGIINTQYISVLERTREIGLMKALGMRGRSVSRLFQYEAAWIGFLGGLIGVIFAVVMGSIANPYINEALSLGDGNYLLIFQPIPIVGIMIVLIIIAMLAGWFPARKAAKLDPIEALRTE